MLEIIKEHNPSSYFWIMPAKVLDLNKNSDKDENIKKLYEYEISIEEETVWNFLMPFILKYFDEKLAENKARYLQDYEKDNTYNYFGKSLFIWNLMHNYFTFEQIKDMVKEINEVSNILKNDYDNWEQSKKSEECEWVVSHMFNTISNKYTNEQKWNFVKENIIQLTEFYKKFNTYMLKMIDDGRNKGCNVISIMGP